jgi:hypothetical protein
VWNKAYKENSERENSKGEAHSSIVQKKKPKNPKSKKSASATNTKESKDFKRKRETKERPCAILVVSQFDATKQ